ncbi:dubious [Schizosaccharomyces pombe]|uniref:Uncharacterized protein C343.20 n=1 Tax=Schizosaccharomyces pombe (strain 972 / ATCC 24843) TaxID=284812 RepID=YIPK_SCHPO|nr:uncharacterized protein SPAC343.20 [Schizosaccharomyces pombe]Q9C111.1 RecName: Full=Uncharacterized protein C343.20 [Schizosaccharomyces pombe 972h-]CAC34962.1 dubious [Schizosaccharomyces pombe]|eukprot:NP_593433.1 uncharacterized protein SPAC343.20 [Schizosaccharomyces pombe]
MKVTMLPLQLNDEINSASFGPASSSTSHSSTIFCVHHRVRYIYVPRHCLLRSLTYATTNFTKFSKFVYYLAITLHTSLLTKLIYCHADLYALQSIKYKRLRINNGMLDSPKRE